MAPFRSTEPVNKNIALENKFSFQILKLPHVKYFCKRVTLPGLSIDLLQIDYPFRKHPYAGTKLNYDQTFTIEFDVDEDLKNYREIKTWMTQIGFPDNFQQYQALLRQNTTNPPKDNGAIYSDGRLALYTNHFSLRHEIAFTDMFPTNLGEMSFQTTDSNPLTCTVTFAYSKFEFQTD